MISINATNSNLVIYAGIAERIQRFLMRDHFSIRSNKNITFLTGITWNTHYDLFIVSREFVTFTQGSYITSYGSGSLIIKAGMENPHGEGAVLFEGESPMRIMDDGIMERGRISMRGIMHPISWTTKN